MDGPIGVANTWYEFDLMTVAAFRAKSSVTMIVFDHGTDIACTAYVDIKLVSLNDVYAYSSSTAATNGSVSGFAGMSVVNDNDATDKYALRLTSANNATEWDWSCNAFVSFDRAISFSDYFTVQIYVKADVGSYAYLFLDNNGTGLNFIADGEYHEYDLKTFATNNSIAGVTNLKFGEYAIGSHNIYIDKIVFVGTFEGAYSPRTNGSIFGNVALVADNTCESGYATKVDVTSSTWNKEYLILDLATPLDPSLYQAVIVRIKASTANWLGISTDGWDWTDAKIAGPIDAADTWYEFDLMTVAAFREKSSVTMIVFDHGSEYACTAYVDIKLVPLNAN
jgi:hypothetical protein